LASLRETAAAEEFFTQRREGAMKAQGSNDPISDSNLSGFASLREISAAEEFFTPRRKGAIKVKNRSACSVVSSTTLGSQERKRSVLFFIFCGRVGAIEKTRRQSAVATVALPAGDWGQSPLPEDGPVFGFAFMDSAPLTTGLA
jgi:hypothetical protein